MVCFSPSIEQQKHFIIAKLKIWVWCGVAIMNTQIRYVYTDAVTNHLHDKAAELCLANIKNNGVTTTKYTRYFFYHMVLVKFYCDVPTRSHLQLIDTSINTFLVSACLVEQRRRREAGDN